MKPTPEQDSLLKTYARQCLARHLRMRGRGPMDNTSFAERNPSVWMSNCAYRAILAGTDSWERIKKSVAETLEREKLLTLGSQPLHSLP